MIITYIPVGVFISEGALVPLVTTASIYMSSANQLYIFRRLLTPVHSIILMYLAQVLFGTSTLYHSL